MNLIEVVGHFLTLFFLVILMWIGVTYVTLNIQYSSARQFFDDVVEQLEDHYFEEETCKECQRKAEEGGYKLTIETYGEEGSMDARVILEMVYVYPVIQVSKSYRLEGYAR